MPGPRDNRMTVYDMMDRKGVFSANKHNPDFRPADGGEARYELAQYPKMLYHPKGEQEKIQSGNWETDPNSGKRVLIGEIWQTKFKLAQSLEEETVLLEAGWHKHPADAERAGGREGGPKAPEGFIPAKDVEAEMSELKAKLAAAEAQLQAQAMPKVEPAKKSAA